MAKIGRSFDELDSKIKALNTDIKSTDREVKQLDADLKINPGSVDTIRKKYSLLSQNLQSNAQKLEALRERQRRLTADYNSGAITQETYNRQLAKTRQQITATEKSVEELTVALNKQNAEIREAKFTNMCNGLDKAKEKTEKLSKVTLALVGALAAVFAQAMNVGAELDDNAKKYDTTAEKLQIMGNRYSYITGNADGYYQALTKVGAMQSSIASGRGARYLKYLNQLGLTEEDLAHKTNAEVYETIEAALAKVTDSTERAIIAQGLFGEVGLNVATVAGASAEEIRKWDEVLIQNGIITNDQAATAAAAADRWDELKLKFQSTSMELLVALMPAFETLTEFLKTAVIPLISTLAGWLGGLGSGGQKIVLILLLVIVLLPKIIAGVKGFLTLMHLIKTATMAQTAATAGLNAVSTPWLGIITAISLALMALIGLLSWFLGDGPSGVIDSANGMLTSIDGLSEKMDEMDADMGYNATSTHETNSHRSLDINLDVKATGDGTAINEENAKVVADNLHDKILIDLVNNELGGVVR